MSSKHLRRLLEEKDKLDKAAEEDKGSSEEEEVGSTVNRFALFDDNGSDKNDTDNNDSEPEENPVEQVESKSSNKRNKKKKKKEKSKSIDESVDDMMRRLVLEQMLMRKNERVFDFAVMKDVFKVDPKKFDFRNELMGLLGRTLKNPMTHPKFRNHRPKRLHGRILKFNSNWPPIKSIGLTMEPVNEENTEFRFSFGRYYAALERMGILGERSLDIEVAKDIIKTEHWHLHSLLLLAISTFIGEDVTVSMDFLERGIYFCQHTWNTLYDYTSLEHRIPYKYYENRIYYLLLHRYMLLCIHKSCFDTALNYAKLICTLDITADPLAMFLVLDTIAIKAKKYDWFDSLLEAYSVNRKMSLLPNFAYSKAMVAFLRAETDKERKESSKLLQEAIKKFPGVVNHLINVLGIRVDYSLNTNGLMNDMAFYKETEGFQLVAKIYVKQSKDLWEQPQTLLWLEKATRVVCNESRRQDSETGRFMIEWRERRLKSFVGVAEEVRRLGILLDLVKNDPSTLTDPAPPDGQSNDYLMDSIREEALRSEPTVPEGFFASFLNSILPNYDPSVPLIDRIQQAVGIYSQMNFYIGRDIFGIRRFMPRDPNQEIPQLVFGGDGIILREVRPNDNQESEEEEEEEEEERDDN